MTSRLHISLLKILLLFFVSLTGCTEKKVETFDVNKFENLVFEAIKGNVTANDTLGNLFDLTLPPPKVINKLKIDSVKSFDNKQFYTLLIESENPIYNRFAVYDSSLVLYLKDLSLNGYLSWRKIGNNYLSFFEVTEEFRTKDRINLKRKSFYRITKDTVTLSLRIFSDFDDGVIKINQTVDNITPEVISTILNGHPDFPLSKMWSNFLFDPNSLMYKEYPIYFDSLVTILINKSADGIEPAIRDIISAHQSLGIEKSASDKDEIKNGNDQFTMFVPEGWRLLRNVSISKQLLSPQTGTYILNPSLGASFSIIKIEESQRIEDFIQTTVTDSVAGNYIVRFSEKIRKGNNYFRFFEISCLSLKFVIVFESPMRTYENNKKIFEEMISSFGVKC